uniref:EF-hand domain pair-containing protein n=1 Tax=Trepomonas sp. PC1 TaxID=1076344 RepID=A0A146KE58_9EUKA|eukprot:JAP93786.1 EF-hand domain pair-containing protein [Trepomonas sp. PC1]
MFQKPNYEQCQKVFAQLDQDNSKLLDINEVALAFKLLGVKLGYDELEGILQIVDQDGNNQLDIDEFMHMVYICQNTKQNDLALLLFLAADKDFSGLVDPSELHNIFIKMDAEISQQEANDLASKISGTKDGLINYEQFKEMLKEIMD